MLPPFGFDMYQLSMSLDPMEKDRLRRKMADRMRGFLESATRVECISGHYYGEPHLCELCGAIHAHALFVIKNRPGKLMRVAESCLREMVRFQVTDVDELPRWLEKVKGLKAEHERREADKQVARQEERRLLEKRVIVRKRAEKTA